MIVEYALLFSDTKHLYILVSIKIPYRASIKKFRLIAIAVFRISLTGI